MDAPRNWMAYVNKPESADELEALQRSLKRGRPFGSDAWVIATAKRLELTHTMRARGRPKKEE